MNNFAPQVIQCPAPAVKCLRRTTKAVPGVKSLVLEMFPFYDALVLKKESGLPQPPRPSLAASPSPADANTAPDILLMVAGADAALAYLGRLSALGATGEVAHDMAAMVARLREQAFNGIVLDVPTLIKDKSYDKRIITELTDFFPLLRARFDTADARILALSSGGTIATGDVFADFVLTRCAGFPARRIRASDRVNLCLNVLVAPLAPGGAGPGGASGARRTCVLDVSAGGCFIWDTDPPPAGQMLRIAFTDRSGDPAALARVVWRQPWGERPAPPGAGLEFEELAGDVASWFASLSGKSA